MVSAAMETYLSDTGGVKVDRHPVGDDTGVMALVTLNRPDEMNPLDWDTLRDLRQVFDDLADDAEVRVVAVTGAGRAFSAGGDMKKYRDLQRDSRDFPKIPGRHPCHLRCACSNLPRLSTGALSHRLSMITTWSRPVFASPSRSPLGPRSLSATPSKS